MTTATNQRVDLPEEQLEWLFSTLGREERTELVLSVLEQVRKDVVELDNLQSVFANWAATAVIRHNPDFLVAVKDYKRLAETGDLFAGTDLTESERAAIQRTILVGG